MSSSPTIHIIGAGMAGLAAGLAAVQAGGKVAIYEAAPQAGGRCRSFYDKKLKMEIDNGNHLVLGANPSVLKYMVAIGTLKDCISSDPPSYPVIDLMTRKHFHLQPPNRYPGVKFTEWWHVFKLWKPKESKTVAECFPKNSGLYQRVIEPMTLAILNTAPEKASARLLRDVLYRLIREGKMGWRYFAMPHGLSKSLVDPALTKIKAKGGAVHLGEAVSRLETDGDHIKGFSTTKGEVKLSTEDKIILATHPAVLQNLLPEPPEKLDYEPILNVHFAWKQAGQFREQMPFLGLLNATTHWIFFHEGRISTTTSAASAELMETDEEELAHHVWNDVCQALYLHNVKMPPYRIIKEKRATYAATPENLAKLTGPKTKWNNLYLAGDYVNPTLPSTLEAAVSSGFHAAYWATNID